MPLRVHITDSGVEAWRVVAEARRDGASIVCSALARDHALQVVGGATFGRDSILGLDHLFNAVADELPDAPPAPRSALVRLHGLRELLVDLTLPDELIALRDRGAEELLSWIDRVEERADRDHREHASTPVERGIEHLRERLAERELLSRGAWRARLARRAKDVRYPRALVVAPQDLSDLAVSGLLKGLSVRQEVRVVGLAPRAGVRGWLADARMGGAWSTDDPDLGHVRSDAVSALLSGSVAAGGIELLVAGDEIEAALGVVAAWHREGVPASEMAIVCPAPQATLAWLEERAFAASVPLLARLQIGAGDALLGGVLRALARDPSDPGARAEAARAGIDPQEIARVAVASDAPARVVALARMAQRRSLNSGQGALAVRDLHLAQALLEAAEEARELLPVPPASDIVDSARSLSRTLGDPTGVALAGYPDAAGLGRGHLICLGLSADQWPPRPRPSPFASAQMMASVAGLRPRDRGPEFMACLCAAEEAVLIRQGLDGQGRDRPASLMWVTAQSAGAAIRPSDGPRAPRQGASGLRPEREADERARMASAERRDFTVDEIARYKSCPLGWFAAEYLPSPARDPERVRGEVAHAALAAAFEESLDPEVSLGVRHALASAVFEKHCARGAISVVDAGVLLERCRRVIGRYSPPAWPFRTIAVERPLRMVSKDGGTVITGRVDRLDESAHGVLVIDYKLNRPTELRSAGRLIHDPQATLYPLMVDRDPQLGPPLGTLFVSLARGDHDGLVKDGPVDLWGQNVVFDADLLRVPAVQAAMRAIEGMREGRIERGPYCPSGCPCRRLPWGVS